MHAIRLPQCRVFSRLGLASAGGFEFVVDGASPKNAVRLSVRKIASTSRAASGLARCAEP